ncbi:hypothetical protein NPX13_g176 [Xylaria arbuscula]|uniref:D-3-phosphoglycerate dehydrogenase n=1 Tax=Xylaria arbuscula TaxID=114810 RepID=A0A9W8NPC0_9PEZI|nr:hypothetical protein NPX13_g176 [Xylaria arbuscula]
MAPGALLPEDTLPVTFDKPTIYVMDKFHPKVEEYLKEHSNPIFPGDPKHGQWHQKAQYILVRSAHLTVDDVESCPRLLAVGKQGVGTDKIDAAACKKRGIRIFNTPGVNARAVAELVLTLTMATARGVGRIVSRQSEGVLVPKETCKGLILHKRKLGLIGMGNIGKMAAQIFRGAFEATVIAYDPYLPADAWSDLPHERAGIIEDVLRTADVISVHVPLTESTRNLISYEQMKMMKPDAIIINTARGGIVNEADLEVAVREGLIWGAGLDCHEQEPPSKEKYGGLWDLGVVSTPHIGAATDQTQMETGMAAAQKLLAFATGKP